eukprot:CAMPEP_0196825852 /NCGR_PEP_ID=MMETSP1362-20130617/93297_1 /TAXON_ID=163516 /ORGANISM="Leptocylindrus danicus, Strain CCMP1856" /LENGTH=214 /DNA_ID=CAMNT_0042206351 /DNA_START=618 /DNA_END=1262 /DNA_ORIENTATION=+
MATNQAQQPTERKRLELKPPTTSSSSPRSPRSPRMRRTRSSSCKSNPFGDAKPREEVLQIRGVDPAKMDQILECKASVKVFTENQNLELEAVRAELTKAEAKLREANEKELPEEAHRVVVEAKRNELNALVKKFTRENEQKQQMKSSTTTVAKQEKRDDGHNNRPKFERVSERRRRMELERANASSSTAGTNRDDVFSSFGGYKARKNRTASFS